MKKHLLSICIVVFLSIFSSLFTTVSALFPAGFGSIAFIVDGSGGVQGDWQPLTTSGKCGDNLKWSFDESSGMLTITGKGPMYSFENPSSNPWNEHNRNSEFYNLRLGYSVASIGYMAFQNSCVQRAWLDSQYLEYIDCLAFSNCTDLVEVRLYYGLKRIGERAFENCSNLPIITIPKTVTVIEKDAFIGCNKLTICGFPGSYAETYANENNIPFEPIEIKPGTIVNHYQNTDIKAFIDSKAIRSYNIDGNTAIIAEDLAKYGFSVEWNDKERSLNIFNDNKTVIGGVEGTPTKGRIGTRAGYVYHTDIVTYVNGKQVTSYNIGGMTAIIIDDLSAFGNISWDGITRTISFTR